MNAEAAPRVQSLHVYPVKSLGGVELQSARLGPLGFEHDRQWMLVSDRGQFITQREHPRMALVKTAFSESGVELSLAGHGRISLPFEARDGRRIRTSVWGDVCETIDQGEEVSAWLGQVLKLARAPRLVRMAAGYQRPQRRPERYGADTTTLFADGAPYLVANQASLDTLNAALRAAGHAAVPMNRFRPNIVLAGLPAFAEHRFRRVRGPAYSLDLAYPCERCVITTVDQASGEAHPGQQPWQLLRTINPMPAKPQAPAFAVNSVLLEGSGSLAHVGDQLQAAA